MAKDDDKKGSLGLKPGSDIAPPAPEAAQDGPLMPGDQKVVVDATTAPPLSGLALAQKLGEETVTKVFPRPVTLTLDNHQRVQFGVGAQEVPVSLKDHWYLRANGVKDYERS